MIKAKAFFFVPAFGQENAPPVSVIAIQLL
jgi:hypothetical protein